MAEGVSENIFALIICDENKTETHDWLRGEKEKKKDLQGICVYIYGTCVVFDFFLLHT